MARYLLFAGASYYPAGGSGDLRTWSDDLEALTTFAGLLIEPAPNTSAGSLDWWRIFDTTSQVEVARSHPRTAINPWRGLPLSEASKVCASCGRIRAASLWPFTCDECDEHTEWVDAVQWFAEGSPQFVESSDELKLGFEITHIALVENPPNPDCTLVELPWRGDE